MKILRFFLFAAMLCMAHGGMAQEDGELEKITLPTREIDGKTFYEVSSGDDMVKFTKIVMMYNRKNANGILTNDIDMTDKVPMVLNDYNGTFDGDFHVISNLRMERTNTVGLFTTIKSDAVLKRIIMKDAQVTGTEFVSVLCGSCHSGKIMRCAVEGGTLTATAESYGMCAPICAVMDGNATVEGCYSAGVNVNTHEYGAGIAAEVRSKDATVTNCFSFKNVYSGSHGGITARLFGKVEDCFTDAGSVSQVMDVSGGVSNAESSVSLDRFRSGYVTLHLNKGRFVGSLAWYQNLDDKNSLPTFNGTEDMIVTEHTCKQGIAYLNPTQFDNDGFCRECDNGMPIQENDGWYDISLPGQLYEFNRDIKFWGRVRLLNDIVINKDMLNSDGELLLDESSLRKWECRKDFHSNAIFDGQNHSISGLYCKNETGSAGFLHSLNENSTVRNLCIRDSYFYGKNNVGGIALGIIEPINIEISNCIVSAKLEGHGYTGSIIGLLYDGQYGPYKVTIANCTVSGSINSEPEYLGALIGGSKADNVDVSDCNISDAFGKMLVGDQRGTLIDTNTTFFTESQAKSGEMTYLLNNKTTSPYRQHLGKDFGPVFTSDVDAVVYPAYCDIQRKVFSNENNVIHDRAGYKPSTVYPGAEENSCVCRKYLDLKFRTTENPNHPGTYYSTFYDSKNEFVVSDGMTPYTGKVMDRGDHRVLTLYQEPITIPKGLAVVLKGSTPEMELSKTDFDIKAPEENDLTGSDMAHAAPANSYVFTIGQQGLGFYRYGEGKTIPAHKAYLVNNAQSAKPLVMVFADDDVPTAVHDIGCGDNLTPSTPYNLNGMRLLAPQRGLNIVNGMKFMKK